MTREELNKVTVIEQILMLPLIKRIHVKDGQRFLLLSFSWRQEGKITNKFIEQVKYLSPTGNHH